MTALRYFCDHSSFLVDEWEAISNARLNPEAAWHVGTATGAADDTASMPAFALRFFATGGARRPAPAQRGEAHRVGAVLPTWPAQELAKELH